MTASSSIFAGTINFFCTGVYYFLRKSSLPKDGLVKQCSGIATTALLNSARSYTNPYLKQWFDDRQLDCIHGIASISIISLVSYYAKLSLKTQVMTLVFFPGLHLGVHKLTSYLFHDQLAIERENRHRQKSTFQNANWLRSELFPLRQGYRAGNVMAYLYAMPDGFFVFLSESKGLPFFSDRLGSIDASEVCKIQEETCGSLQLSPEALQKLLEQANQVSFDGGPNVWQLSGVPPFICFEGKWNGEHNPLGTAVNWEDLILRGLTQRHTSFELSPLSASWTRLPETPHLRGFNFNHSDCRFNIWVHEKNPRALENEQRALSEEIKDFHAMLTFIRNFESAAFIFLSTRTFPTTRRGAVDWNALQNWGNLTCQIPFPHLTSLRYPDLAEQVRAYKRNQTEAARQSLYDAFLEFFETLPKEAYFPTDTVLCEMFQNAGKECVSANRDLVRSNGFIVVKSLETWLNMLQRVHYHFGTCPELDELIDQCHQYIAINNQLQKRPSNPEPLRQKRSDLDPILKKGFQWFFETHERKIRNKGKFAEDLEFEILAREKKAPELEAFKLCEQGIGNFSIETYLKAEDGTLRVIPLEAWTKILEIDRFCGEQQYQQLLADCRNYQTFHIQSPLTQEKIDLIDRIIGGYSWFFGTYITHLEAETKRAFLEKLASIAKCPRSHVTSTAQIAYYSYLKPSHLRAIIRRNRAYQLSTLIGAISSEVDEASYSNHNLPKVFCDRLNEVCNKASDFMVRKAQNFKILEPNWTFDQGNLQIETQAQYNDGSEYRFKPLQGTKTRNAHRHLNQVSQALMNLHTLVIQTSEPAYLKSPFLAEEATVITDLYRIANELLFLLQVPIRWNLHRQLHEHSLQTKKAEKALSEGRNYSIYKRISDGGHILWDIVRDNEKSEIETRNTVHTAIYY